MDNRSARATSRTTGRTRGADAGQWSAGAQRGDPVAMDELSRALLPAAQRDVIVVIDLLGLPAERAAERLGIGVRAAKSRLHRARKALAAAIASPPPERKTA